MWDLWFVSGQSNAKTLVPIHQLVGTMNVDVDVDVIEIFPAVHALTGCETSCKIRTKAAALKTAEEL